MPQRLLQYEMRIILNVIPLFYRYRLCQLKHKPSPKITSFPSSRNFRTTSEMASNTTENEDIFLGKTDRFQGVTVRSDKEPCGSTEFAKKLEGSLEFWKTSGKRGIWFKVHLDHSEWVPILAKNGFKYHHAKEDYVMMYRWLPTLENCNIPHYAHTMVGVGAVVVNNKDQVLVVTEKYNILNRPFWKLPGGYVEPGENLVDAAIREVWEETGISTEFESVLTLRHAHGGMFNCSDIYAVVSLRPLSEDIEKCEREIADCKWMDIEEYMTHPHVHELNRFFLQKHLEYEKHNIKMNCFHGIHQVLNKAYTVYSVTKRDLPAIERGEDSGSKPEGNT